MELSETILAAMIGAGATVATALFQLYMAFKSRAKSDVRPKRGSTMRSIFAVVVLMAASAAGGFLYSELLKQRSDEEIRAMRLELRELKDLTASSVRGRAPQSFEAETDAAGTMPVAMESGSNSVESVVYVPACRRAAASPTDAACTEADAQRIALCGTVPWYARVDSIDLFVQPDAVQQPWERHRVAFEQDLGGARFVGKSFEYAQLEDRKAVCVNFMHWSSDHPHIARIVVQYGFGDRPETEAAPAAAPSDAAPAQLPTVAAAAEAAATQPASFIAPGPAQ
jgi:hypothetical protein